MEPLLLKKKVNLRWQPPGYRLEYKYDKQLCHDIYRPDALLVWNDTGDEWVIEIKRGALHQKSASKMKRFCQQYPDKRLVLVWYERFPTRKVIKRRLDRLRPHLDHVWHIAKL
jgi:hypothetical protein